jgi:hypothetical protein
MSRAARLAPLVLGLVALTSSFALPAAAEHRHRVVVLERGDDDETDREITTRLRAELGAAGFDVIMLQAGESDPKHAVEGAGRELHPASVLLVERASAEDQQAGEDKGTELWLADRMLRKTVVLRLKPEAPGRATDANAGRSQQAARIAVQAVELVKARLAELSLTREREREREAQLSAPAVPAAPLLPPEPELRGARPNLTAAVGMLEGFQEGQQSLTLVLRLGVALPEHWTGDVLSVDVRGSFVGLGRAAKIEHGPGAAKVRHTAVEMDLVMRFLPHRSVQPFVSLGGGMLALDVTGEAPEPYRNDSARTLSGLLTASGGIWLKPTSTVGLALEGQLVSAWSKTVVRIAGEDAAEVASPLLLLSAGLMAEF